MVGGRQSLWGYTLGHFSSSFSSLSYRGPERSNSLSLLNASSILKHKSLKPLIVYFRVLHRTN